MNVTRNIIANLYLKERPHNLVAKVRGFHDHWNLSLGYIRYGNWLGPSLPFPTGFLRAILFGSISSVNYSLPTLADCRSPLPSAFACKGI